MLYRWPSQYCSSERALLLFQVLLAVLSRAFSPKTRSRPEQLVKACSRSMVYSDGDAREEQRGKYTVVYSLNRLFYVIRDFISVLELNLKPRTVAQIG